MEYDPVCDTLRNCFLMIFDKSFKETAGFITGDKDYKDEWNDYGRVLFDIIYLFIVVTIMREIMSGIIIDTFKSLREYEELKEKDKREMCFICGKHSSEFENSQGGFKRHIKE